MLGLSGVHLGHVTGHVTRLHPHFYVVGCDRGAVSHRNIPSHQQRVRGATDLRKEATH